MKKFFKDFWNLQKMGTRFLKEHWFGYIILCGVLTVIEIFWIGIRYGFWCFDWMEKSWKKLTGVFTKA